MWSCRLLPILATSRWLGVALVTSVSVPDYDVLSIFYGRFQYMNMIVM